MATDRIDHLARLRGDTPEGEAPKAENPKEAPRIPAGLVEYLERAFPVPAPERPWSLDTALNASHQSAERVGVLTVIQHLRQLYANQEG